MSSADILRSLAGADQALTDGADALDQVAKDQATIAGLQASLDAAAKLLAAQKPYAYTVQPGDTLSGIATKLGVPDWHSLQAWNGLSSTTIKPGQQLLAIITGDAPPPPPPPPPPAASRFPGDPGAGKIVVGAIVSGAAGTADAWEKANGVKLGSHRSYWKNGIGDFAPGGPIVAYCKAEHAAGRVPMVSGKLDWSQTTAGAYDKQLAAFRDAIEGLGKPVDVIVNHEPENDGQPAAQFVAEQRHIRGVFGRGLQRLSFGGSLMAYDWAAASGRTPDDWFPGNAADGQPTWDWAGIDQYAQQSGAPIDDAKFEAALVSLTKWGVPPAFTELGIRSSDAGAPAKLAALFDKALAHGFVKLCWYDSTTNSTQNGWVLTGPLLAAFVKLLQDPRAVRPAA